MSCSFWWVCYNKGQPPVSQAQRRRIKDDVYQPDMPVFTALALKVGGTDGARNVLETVDFVTFKRRPVAKAQLADVTPFVFSVRVDFVAVKIGLSAERGVASFKVAGEDLLTAREFSRHDWGWMMLIERQKLKVKVDN